MKKVSIIVLICFSTFGFIDIIYRCYGDVQKGYLSVLQNDTLIVTKETGFDFSDKQELAQMSGITQIRYNDQQLDQPMVINSESEENIQISVLDIPVDAIDYFDYNLSRGTGISKDKQIIISETVAKYLQHYQIIGPEVIGQKINLGQDYTIVGVFRDLHSSKIDILNSEAVVSNTKLGEVGAIRVDFKERSAGSKILDIKDEEVVVSTLSDNQLIDRVAFIKIDNPDDNQYVQEKIKSRIEDAELVSNGTSILDLSNLQSRVDIIDNLPSSLYY